MSVCEPVKTAEAATTTSQAKPVSKFLRTLAKRRCYKFDIDGEPFYVRALTIGESREFNKIEDADTKAAFGLGCALCNEDATPVFERQPGEDAVAFATRITPDLEAVPQDTLILISDAVGKVSKDPPMDALQKS